MRFAVLVRVTGLCLVVVLGGLVAGCSGDRNGTSERETVTVNGHVLTVEKLTTMNLSTVIDSMSVFPDGTCIRYGKGPSGEVYRCP